jgi:hypothetical protein
MMPLQGACVEVLFALCGVAWWLVPQGAAAGRWCRSVVRVKKNI